MKPSANDIFTPSLSIKYPDIVNPYAKRNRADTQNRMPASYWLIPNSYSQKTRNVKSSIRKVREVANFMTKMTQSSHVYLSQNSWLTADLD